MEKMPIRDVEAAKLHEQLRYTLSNVNDWLKFAEAKNAALVAANIGAAFGAFRVASTPNLHPLAFYYALFAAGILLLSTGVALASFVPQLKIPLLPQLRDISPEESVLFYGHIAECNPKSYLRELYTKNRLVTEEIAPLEIDYAAQIVVNSQIAVRKYQLFSLAVYFTITALASPIFTLLLIFYKKRLERKS